MTVASQKSTIQFTSRSSSRSQLW